MASRRVGKAAVTLAERLLTAARRGRSSPELRRRAFSWETAKVEYPEPRFLTSASPWTCHRPLVPQPFFPFSLQVARDQPFLFASAEEHKDSDADDVEDSPMNIAETRKIVLHVNAVALKKRLKLETRESVSFRELLDMIKGSGLASDEDDAKRYARSLDEAGVVLIFRENVYLRPETVAKLVANALPFAVVPPNDPRRLELVKLEERKGELDAIAHNLVRRYLWTGLLALTCQAALFFRLTFWELSWDVMEPIAFFVTSAGLIAGYTYFLITARDPSYRDFMQRLFVSKQMKVFKKHHFDYVRYQLLKRQCQCLEPDDRQW